MEAQRSNDIIVASAAPRHAIVQALPNDQVTIRKVDQNVVILINGARLGSPAMPLLHGDKVVIGECELVFVDEQRNVSTLYEQAPPSSASTKPSSHRAATAKAGGRLISLTDGREYAITGGSLVMGRDASCHVVLTSKNVSRRHAEIIASPKGYLLVDHSTNGTLVNRERVEGQCLLERGDIIRCGDDEFRFYSEVASL